MPVERLLISGAERTTYGALAQLGERLLCTQEVRGSIPLGSTTFPEAVRTTASFRFRAHPGGIEPARGEMPGGHFAPEPGGRGPADSRSDSGVFCTRMKVVNARWPMTSLLRTLYRAKSTATELVNGLAAALRGRCHSQVPVSCRNGTFLCWKRSRPVRRVWMRIQKEPGSASWLSPVPLFSQGLGAYWMLVATTV